MTTIRSASDRWHLPSIEQCKMCGAFFMMIVVAGESAIPRHECPTRQPRCDAAIKQDNQDGPENEKRPLQVQSAPKAVATSSMSANSWSVAFDPPILQTPNDLAVKSNRNTDDNDKA